MALSTARPREADGAQMKLKRPPSLAAIVSNRQALPPYVRRNLRQGIDPAVTGDNTIGIARKCLPFVWWLRAIEDPQSEANHNRLSDHDLPDLIDFQPTGESIPKLVPEIGHLISRQRIGTGLQERPKAQ
jgi:hypothetical protein